MRLAVTQPGCYILVVLTVIETPSGNHGGTRHETKYIVIHYTASDSAAGSVAWLRSPASRASAHFVISQKGELYQLVPTDLVAWHAGASRYQDDRSLNLCSVGIELVNPGPVSTLHKGIYTSGHLTYLEDQVTHAGGRVWANYPEPQLEVLGELIDRVQSQYGGALALVGHEEICDPPGRKQDPGPAFPWVRFRSATS